MKLIATVHKVEKEFLRLQNQYDEYYWMTAWASSGSKAFENLILNKQKIKKIIVGIHFYQTHPDFIKTFLKKSNVQISE